MRRLIWLVLMVAAAAVAAERTVEVSTIDFTQQRLRTRVTLKPLYQEAAVGSDLVNVDDITKVTDAAGKAFFSNVVAGPYMLNIAGRPGTGYKLMVGTNEGHFSAAALRSTSNAPAVNPQFLTIGTADARYALKGETAGGSTLRITDWDFDVDTNLVYRARSGDGSVSWSSNNFSGLLQAAHEASQEATVYRFGSLAKGGGSYYRYELSNTVVFTKSAVLVGLGNPITIMRPAAGMTNALFQFGTANTTIDGIARVEKIRFEGDTGGPGAVGLHFRNVAEPTVMDCEINQFTGAAIRITSPNIHWSFVQNSWIWVPASAGAIGLLLDATNTAFTELFVDNTQFLSQGGRHIVVSNDFKNLVVRNNRFRNTGSDRPALTVVSGSGVLVSGNSFSGGCYGNAVVFEPRDEATNVAALVTGNLGMLMTNWVSTGSNVEGVFEFGNLGVARQVVSRLAEVPAASFTVGYGNDDLGAGIYVGGFTNYGVKLGAGIVTVAKGTSPQMVFKAHGFGAVPAGEGNITFTTASGLGNYFTLSSPLSNLALYTTNAAPANTNSLRWTTVTVGGVAYKVLLYPN